MTPLAKLLEAALFASARPIATDELAALDTDASPAELQSALDEIREHYDVDGHGVELVEIGGGWQILTRAEYTEAIERAQLAARPARLSGAALETLAIIAYRQPISRAEIEEIRGVAVGSVLKSLHERGLIDVVGRARRLGSSTAVRNDADLPRAFRAASSRRAAARRRAGDRAPAAAARGRPLVAAAEAERVMSETMRIQRALARAGVASRRKAEELIVAGRVHVNGEVAHTGQTVDPSRDMILGRRESRSARPPPSSGSC